MLSTKKTMIFTSLIIAIASIGGLLYGYDLSVISGALIYIRQSLGLTPNQLSFIVAAVLGGGSLATLVSGFFADKFGRRTMIFIAAAIFILGILIIIEAHSFAVLFMGRLIQGIGIGIVTIVIPLYLVETAPSNLRGRSITMFECFINAGIFIASIIDLAFAVSANWRGMFASALIPGALLLIGAVFITESPSWLFIKGRSKNAFDALLRTRSLEQANEEFELMKHNEKQEKTTLMSFFDKKYCSIFIFALSIAILNQLTGINTLIQFSTFIIINSGISSVLISMFGTLAITFAIFLATLGTFFLIDYYGRRPLMIIGTGGVAIALLLLSIIYFVIPTGEMKGVLVIATLVVYILCYAMGPGVIVWLIISELLPLPIRSKGMAVCLFINSLVSTAVAGSFLNISKHIGYGGVFLLFSLCSFIYFAVVTLFLPESKNVPLEEIDYRIHLQLGSRNSG